MNIVLIAYRPDHTDVCRGCVMGSTAADMEYGVFNNIEEASDFMAHYMKENEVRDVFSFAAYEFSCVINGADYETGGFDDDYDYNLAAELEGLARKKTNALVEKYHTAEAERIAKTKEEQAERTRQQELKTLAKLQEKHGKI